MRKIYGGNAKCMWEVCGISAEFMREIYGISAEVVQTHFKTEFYRGSLFHVKNHDKITNLTSLKRALHMNC